MHLRDRWLLLPWLLLFHGGFLCTSHILKKSRLWENSAISNQAPSEHIRRMFLIFLNSWKRTLKNLPARMPEINWYICRIKETRLQPLTTKMAPLFSFISVFWVNFGTIISSPVPLTIMLFPESFLPLISKDFWMQPQIWNTKPCLPLCILLDYVFRKLSVLDTKIIPEQTCRYIFMNPKHILPAMQFFLKGLSISLRNTGLSAGVPEASFFQAS